jgi:6,7-dimethyl-8-ribityllumazine synthase
MNKMILIVASKFDKSQNNVVNKLIKKTTHFLEQKSNTYKLIRVPGANEIPSTVQHFLEKYKDKYSVIITLGLILKGNTDHYDMVKDYFIQGITYISSLYNIPIIQGVLACHTKEQANERIDLGTEFAKTAIEMKKIKEL